MFNFPEKFILATLQRAVNTDNKDRLKEIVLGLNKLNNEIPVIIPLHPRTQKLIAEYQIPIEFFVCWPLGYLQMLYMLKNASVVITDMLANAKENDIYESYLQMKDKAFDSSEDGFYGKGQACCKIVDYLNENLIRSRFY